MNKYIITVLWISAIILSGCGNTNTTKVAQNPTEPKWILWKCLTDKWAIFYGTERCSHCKDQKSEFGNQMIFVPYIDCDKNKSKCTAAWVKWYPTRVFADKSTLVWKQDLDTLAAKVGCEYKG